MEETRKSTTGMPTGLRSYGAPPQPKRCLPFPADRCSMPYDAERKVSRMATLCGRKYLRMQVKIQVDLENLVVGEATNACSLLAKFGFNMKRKKEDLVKSTDIA